MSGRAKRQARIPAAMRAIPMVMSGRSEVPVSARLPVPASEPMMMLMVWVIDWVSIWLFLSYVVIFTLFVDVNELRAKCKLAIQNIDGC